VRVGGDRTNVPDVPDGETAQEIRAKLLADIASSGLLPTPVKKFLSSSGGVLEPPYVVNGSHDGTARK
jgi:hypothetical protein